jgi:hypothetical protein
MWTVFNDAVFNAETGAWYLLDSSRQIIRPYDPGKRARTSQERLRAEQRRSLAATEKRPT